MPNKIPLTITHPELIREIHPAKNPGFDAKKYTHGSHKIIWWKCPVGVDHEWQAAIYHRTSGRGCPVCSNNKRVRSNSLDAVYPILASEWHPTKNGSLTPADVQPYSNKSAWWQCKVNPKHEWKAYVSNRHKAGCPYCGGLGGSRQEIRIYSELLLIFPDVEHHAKVFGKELDVFIPSHTLGIEYDGRHWHKNKQAKDVAKNKFLKSKGVEVIRVREKGLGLTGNNDIEINPESEELEMMLLLAAKIQSLLPSNSIEQASILEYLSERKLLNSDYTKFLVDWFPKPVPGQSLKEKYPQIAGQWHPTRNEYLKPSDVFPHAGQKVWWQCEAGHEWEATIDHRTRAAGTGCPECYLTSERTVNVVMVNRLSARCPSVAKEWHPTMNMSLKPEDVGYKSHKRVWWYCSNQHEWEARIDSRTSGTGCPFCSRRRKT